MNPNIKSFGSPEEMHDYLKRRNDAMDAAIRPWQDAIKPGDHLFMIWEDGSGRLLPIFYEVLNPADSGDRDTMAQTPKRRLVRGYSVDCDDGEAGTIHVASVWAVISAATFGEARSAGWRLPPSLQRFANIRPRQAVPDNDDV